MSDDQYREIHLAGKQLVFLFIASTVVAVVIFLCGVMVGRGVPSARAADPTEFPNAIVEDPTDVPALALAQDIPLPESPVAATPDEFTYPERLERSTPPPDTLRAAKPPVRDPPPAPPRPGSASTPRKAAGGHAVQVMAVTARAAADTVATRLESKGYPSFVVQSDGWFRVRVGPYKDRKEAESIARRLEREEAFTKPMVVSP